MEQLSHREREVALLVTQGLPNKQIARELDIDETTVKTHLHRIFEKLDLPDRTNLAVYVVRYYHGTLPEPHKAPRYERMSLPELEAELQQEVDQTRKKLERLEQTLARIRTSREELNIE